MSAVRRLQGVAYCSVALLGLAFAGPSYASAVISFEEQASGVVATGSGSLDLADLEESFAGYDGFTAVSGANGYAVLGPVPTAFDSVTFLTGATGPASFGTGGYTTATTGSGDRFGIDAASYHGAGTARIWIGATYKSGSALSATDTWAGATFASLGLTPGVYTYSWGEGADADSLQVRIGSPIVGGGGGGGVPEPATWSMMLLGFAVVGATARRRPRPASYAL